MYEVPFIACLRVLCMAAVATPTADVSVVQLTILGVHESVPDP